MGFPALNRTISLLSMDLSELRQELDTCCDHILAIEQNHKAADDVTLQLRMAKLNIQRACSSIQDIIDRL